MRRRSRFGVFLRLIILFLMLLGIITGALYHRDSGLINGYGVPKIAIELNGVSLEEIHEGNKDEKYPDNTLVLSNVDGGGIWNTVEIKGRGNSTWGMEKKSYRIKFDKKVDLLGLGKAKKWVLLADYSDESQLRNDIAFEVAKILDDSFILKGDYVELTIDNKYLGLYYLTESITISKDVVNLTEPDGVLMELENLHCESESEVYLSNDGDCLAFRDVVSYDEKEKAADSFMKKYNNLERAIRLKDYDEVKNNIDVNSFAIYFLISEFTNNPDAYSSSWWMYMDGSDDIIHVGPAWDFDYALGNRNWEHPDSEIDFYNPMLPIIRKKELKNKKASNEYSSISQIMYKLMDFQEFRDLVENVYSDKLAGKESEIISYIRNKSKKIRNGVMRDSEIWEKKNYDEEVEYLIWWVENRFRMMDAVYGSGLIINKPVNEI